MLKVIKKDKTIESFNAEKIMSAVRKAAFRCDKVIDADHLRQIADEVFSRIEHRDQIMVSELHELVIAVLAFLQYKEVADAYAEYRYYKQTYAKTFEQLRQDADDVLRLGDRENANFDSSLVSTKGSLIKGYLTKSLYKQFYLSGREKELIERGDIYIHDLRDMILGCINCCLFDIGNVLKGGFEMSNVQYTEPKTVLSALQVIGDVTLVATAQQFGGFTLAELDKVLLPYVLKSEKGRCAATVTARTASPSCSPSSCTCTTTTRSRTTRSPRACLTKPSRPRRSACTRTTCPCRASTAASRTFSKSTAPSPRPWAAARSSRFGSTKRARPSRSAAATSAPCR